MALSLNLKVVVSWCPTAVCNAKCEHGTCYRPNTCACYPGYTGSQCNERKSHYII